MQEEYKKSIQMLVKVLSDIDPQTTTADEIKDFLISQVSLLVDMASNDQ